MLRRLINLVALVVLIVALPWVAHAQKRVALVIGNGAYTFPLWSDLKNPPNDAHDIAATLSDLGFELIGGKALLDLNKTEMEEAIVEFGEYLDNDTVGLFYYAGHGVQVKGAKYMIPVDAQIESEGDVSIKSIDANDVLAMMEHSGAALNFVILDACRNNPFTRSFRSANLYNDPQMSGNGY